MRIIVAMILLSIPLLASAAEADRDETMEWLELRAAVEEIIDGQNIDEARAAEIKELADRMSEDELATFPKLYETLQGLTDDQSAEIMEWYELREEVKEIISSLDAWVALELGELPDYMSVDELKEFREKSLKIRDNPRAWMAELFRLRTTCASVGLVIGSMSSDAEKIGLTAESVQAAVESRLRSARIYTDVADNHFLYININVMEKVFNIGLSFNKELLDLATGLTSSGSTWRADTLGTHGTGASFILSALSELVDQFLVEYLRVNERACNS